MKDILFLNSISTKLGLLFSVVFLTLLLILGTILYGVFSNLFVDFVTSDLLNRGNSHANALQDDNSQKMLGHVLLMEKGGSTHVIVTDQNHKIVGSSIPPNREMKSQVLKFGKQRVNQILDQDWKRDPYIVTISSIGNKKGYVYMFYPTLVLRETVMVLKVLFLVTSIGTVLLGLGLIGFLSRKITKPLVMMKEATNKIASGKYQQTIQTKGNDELAQLSNSIQQLGEQLQFYEDTRNEFLSAVSHELRTPLTYIKGYSDVLVKGMIQSEEELKDYLLIINREAKRLSFLVNDLFEMGKLQTRTFQLNKEVADIHAIIQKVISTLKPEAEKKGIKIYFSSTEFQEIKIDAQRIEQVIYNLVENAIKYSDDGVIQLDTFLQNEFMVIQVKDSGIGIPQNEIPKIWDQFYRVDKSRGRQTGGSGLGLWIVKQIIHAHNGELSVDSVENEGSIFSVYLPLKS
ncbi:MAG: HAMP domain-containing sensor histidine kinase [Bacillota bacterium]|nr:HAMP domain-containing sensor histidine kinase [Bacillota bacterium]